MSTVMSPSRAEGRESAPLSEALIFAALRYLEHHHPEQGMTFADAPGMTFFGVRDILDALEQVTPRDPETGVSVLYKRSTVAMRLKRMREAFRLAPRQFVDAGAVRGTIGNVYAIPPEGMTPAQMSALFKLSGEEATRQAVEQVNRQFTPRAPRRPATKDDRTTRLYGQVSWKEARETNRLADMAGMRRPQYVAEAVRRFNEEKRRELEQDRPSRQRAAASFAPPLLTTAQR